MTPVGPIIECQPLDSGTGRVFESSRAWQLGYFRIVPSPHGLFGIISGP
jgi:hypothetical protein